VAPVPPLSQLMAPALVASAPMPIPIAAAPPNANAPAQDEKIAPGIIEAVLPAGLYQVAGVAVPATGTPQLAVGTLVPVYFRNGVPVVILAHNARRAPAVRRLAGNAPAVEELLQTGGTTYFRNDQQFTALKAVADALTTTTGSGVVGQLVWGERDNTFCVVATMPVIGVRYFIFRLNRSEGEVLGATKATATLVATLAPPATPIQLPSPKYDTVANIYADSVVGGVPGRYLFVGCSHATYSGSIATDPVYLTRALDVLAPVIITAESTFAFHVLGLLTGRRLGLIQWLKIFSFTRQAFIWESPVSNGATPLPHLGDCGDVIGPITDDAALISAKDTWLAGTENDIVITSGRILAWDERDPQKQLVALSATKSLANWGGFFSGEPPTLVSPGVATLVSRAFYTLIQDGAETTYWDVPQAFSFAAVRTGPRSLRLLGIDGNIIETHVLDLKKKETRDVASTTFGLAKAIAPSDGALIIVDEAASVTGWPGTSARGHFAAPGSFTFETFARDGQLEEFEGLRKYPDGVTPPSGSLGVFAYHVVRTTDLAPALPTLPRTP
jgi:hypothetical protein